MRLRRQIEDDAGPGALLSETDARDEGRQRGHRVALRRSAAFDVEDETRWIGEREDPRDVGIGSELGANVEAFGRSAPRERSRGAGREAEVTITKSAGGLLTTRRGAQRRWFGRRRSRMS